MKDEILEYINSMENNQFIFTQVAKRRTQRKDINEKDILEIFENLVNGDILYKIYSSVCKVCGERTDRYKNMEQLTEILCCPSCDEEDDNKRYIKTDYLKK